MRKVVCELCATLFLFLSLSLGWLRIYIAAYFQAYLWHALTSERAKIMQYNYGPARICPFHIPGLCVFVTALFCLFEWLKTWLVLRLSCAFRRVVRLPCLNAAIHLQPCIGILYAKLLFSKFAGIRLEFQRLVFQLEAKYSQKPAWKLSKHSLSLPRNDISRTRQKVCYNSHVPRIICAALPDCCLIFLGEFTWKLCASKQSPQNNIYSCILWPFT